jgi:hypothetical protein
VDPNGNAWWNWLISGLQIVAGIVLVATGVGAGLGASLIVGGTLGLKKVAAYENVIHSRATDVLHHFYKILTKSSASFIAFLGREACEGGVKMYVSEMEEFQNGCLSLITHFMYHSFPVIGGTFAMIWQAPLSKYYFTITIISSFDGICNIFNKKSKKYLKKINHYDKIIVDNLRQKYIGGNYAQSSRKKYRKAHQRKIQIREYPSRQTFH